MSQIGTRWGAPSACAITCTLLVVFTVGAPGAAAWAAEAAKMTVFAAASLTSALQEIGRLHQQQEQGSLRFSFAASSILARQIEHGAGADLFISADAAWMDYLAERGRIVAASRRTLTGNRLSW